MLSFHRILFLAPLLAIIASCDLRTSQPVKKQPAIVAKNTEVASSSILSTAKIFSERQIPILCYHRLRAWKATDTRSMKDYIVPVETFKEQIKILADSGYHTILPDQLFAHLTTGAPLPLKPVMLTFDDSEEEHY